MLDFDQRLMNEVCIKRGGRVEGSGCFVSLWEVSDSIALIMRLLISPNQVLTPLTKRHSDSASPLLKKILEHFTVHQGNGQRQLPLFPS